VKNGAQQTMKQPTIIPTVFAARFSLFRLRSCEMKCNLANLDAMSEVLLSLVGELVGDVSDDAVLGLVNVINVALLRANTTSSALLLNPSPGFTTHCRP